MQQVRNKGSLTKMVLTLFITISILVTSFLNSGHALDLDINEVENLCRAQIFVDAHNEGRRSVNPSASNMLKMHWSTSLAEIAQKEADKCQIGNNAFAGNTFATSLILKDVDIQGVVEVWFQEINGFDSDKNTCTDNEQCGEYTRVVWAQSDEIGCAVASCDGPVKTLIACSYKPSRTGNQPYIPGTPCSQCPKCGYTCERRLCKKNPYDMCLGLKVFTGQEKAETELVSVENPCKYLPKDRNPIPPIPCNAEGYSLDEKYDVCYKVHKYDKKSAIEAKRACEEEGARLLLVNSCRKRDFMDKVIVTSRLSNIYLQGKREDNGPFKDDDGENMRYFMWDKNEPEDDRGAYLRTDSRTTNMEVSSGRWPRSFICEIRK